LAAAEALAALGANLAIVGRSKTKTRVASARIRAAAGKGATAATFIASRSYGRINLKPGVNSAADLGGQRCGHHEDEIAPELTGHDLRRQHQLSKACRA
jgi:hypothetical protein